MANSLPLDQHIQWRGGTTAALNKFAGVAREITVDTTKNTLVLLSGTAGTNYPLARESRTITGGAGIQLKKGGVDVASVTLADDFTVAANLEGIVSTGKGLKVDATTGKAELDITLDYVAATGVVSVYGDSAKTNLMGSVTIPSHVSSLAVAELLTASTGTPVNGQTSGTFIHFQWLLTNSQTSDMYIDVTTLIDVYTVGDGLKVNAQDSKKFEVKAGNGISADANGTHVAIKTGETIIKSEAAGVSIDQTALKAVTDQEIVSADTGNIITAGTNGGAKLKLASNGLLQTNANGELEVILDFGTITE